MKRNGFIAYLHDKSFYGYGVVSFLMMVVAVFDLPKGVDGFTFLKLFYDKRFLAFVLIPYFMYLQERNYLDFQYTNILMRFGNAVSWWKAKFKRLLSDACCLVAVECIWLLVFVVSMHVQMHLGSFVLMLYVFAQQILVLVWLGILLHLLMLVGFNFYMNFIIIYGCVLASERVNGLFGRGSEHAVTILNSCTTRLVVESFNQLKIGDMCLQLLVSMAICVGLYRCVILKLKRYDFLWK